MGTRSLTHIFDGEQEIACIYRQFDGYPEGLGVDLGEFINSRQFVNGIGDSRKVFNGMGCFAAQLIGHLKGTNAGNVYLYPAGSEDCGEEYTYVIRGGLDRENGMTPLPVTVACIAYGEEKFSGPPSEFLAWCKTPQEQDA